MLRPQDRWGVAVAGPVAICAPGLVISVPAAFPQRALEAPLRTPQIVKAPSL
eukprot:CAMPEP_0173372756 /NCGR_PEP_ID=MMETSP1144-20121109/28094_1 /TAXON_ID=483371 /ORGANISM="non described non described, Strain CCMP2298" /LENGTH=51 /DNA_ID=CAMNT_0014324805 /DNA_START=33 /DNA_END=188 /DNA_ORIENTATION=-